MIDRSDTAAVRPFAYAAAVPRGASLLEILTQVFMDGRRIGAVFLIGLALTVIVSFLPSKKYTADASLLLRLGREYVYTPEVGDTAPGSPIAYDREQTLLAESKILTSRDLKLAVLDKMGVAEIYPHLVWINPTHPSGWEYSGSTDIIRQIIGGHRMFPMTVKGVEEATRELGR